MSPLRGDVLGVAAVLALPLLVLWWRGDFTVDDVTSRLPWCFLASWGAVALVRYALRPPHAADAQHAHRDPEQHDAEQHAGGEHAPAS